MYFHNSDSKGSYKICETPTPLRKDSTETPTPEPSLKNVFDIGKSYLFYRIIKATY